MKIKLTRKLGQNEAGAILDSSAPRPSSSSARGGVGLAPFGSTDSA